MSLIVCIKTPEGVLMGADSQYTQGDRRVPSGVSKLASVTHGGHSWGFGIIGSTSTSHVIQHDVIRSRSRTLTKFLAGKTADDRVRRFSRELRKHLLGAVTVEEADDVQVVTCTGGEIYEITQASYLKIPYDFWATGCGAELAVGALEVMHRLCWGEDPEVLLKEVFEISFKHNYLIAPPIVTTWVR